MKRIISIFLVSEGIVLATNLISYVLFINIQVGFLSSFFIIIGSSYAYNKMVKSQVENENYEDQRDLLDKLDDPHELYVDNDINNAPVEELDLKKIVKEEKAKIKTFSISSAKYGARGSVSAFRLVPYVFLILGFIALKNNNLLTLWYYLPALTFGIITGAVISNKVSS